MALQRGLQTRRPAIIHFEHSRLGSPSVKQMTSARLNTASPVTRGQSLVFQLEVDCKELQKTVQKSPLPQRNVLDVLDRVEQLLRPETSFAARLARDARYYHRKIVEEEGAADVVILGSSLAGVGHAVTIRSAIGGGSGVSAFKHLSHRFLVVSGPVPDGYHVECAEYIVDPRFREQFNIPQAVSLYKDVLHSIPEVYIGIASRLRPLVRLLGAEMAAAFAAAGAVTPPWRTSASLLSKWLPKVSRDRTSTDSVMPTASYPSHTLSQTTVNDSEADHLGRCDSVNFFSRRDFQLPNEKEAETGQRRVSQCSGEKLASQRFGSSRFDASVPIRAARRRSGSATGPDVVEDSVRRISCEPALCSTRRSFAAASAAFEGHSDRQPSSINRLSAQQNVLSGPAAAIASAAVFEERNDGSATLASHTSRHTTSSESGRLLSSSLGQPAKATAITPPAPSTDGGGAEVQEADITVVSRQSDKLGRHIPSSSSIACHEGGKSATAPLKSDNGSTPAALTGRTAPAAVHSQTSMPTSFRSPQAGTADGTCQRPLRTASTSALSRKLACIRPSEPRRHVAAASNGCHGDASRHQVVVRSSQGARHGRHGQQEPSVHAPFWEEPLIVDYIAKQQPGSFLRPEKKPKPRPSSIALPDGDPGPSQRGAADSSLRRGSENQGGRRDRSHAASSLHQNPPEAADGINTSSQPRIRKVKMRGPCRQGPTTAARHGAQQPQ